MSELLLKADNLTKTFAGGKRFGRKADNAVHAVSSVSVHLEPGESLAIVGESGAGKSTLGRLILRLIEPDEGSIFFKGEDLRSLNARALRRRRPQMQMIFQDPYSSLDPKMTIADALAEPLVLHTDMSRTARMDRVEELALRVGIRADQLNRYPDELSGGQLQRIAVARAIANDPALVVCDEPLSALDLSLRAQVLNLLRDIQRDTGVAYLFITHDLSLVRLIASRVMVMRGGLLVEEGPVQDVFDSPSDAYTKELLAAVPVADPRNRRLRDRPPMAATRAAAPLPPLAPSASSDVAASDECWRPTDGTALGDYAEAGQVNGHRAKLDPMSDPATLDAALVEQQRAAGGLVDHRSPEGFA